MPPERTANYVLRTIGMHPDALAAWAGTCHIPLLATRITELGRRPITRASAGLALLVAGVDVTRSLLDSAAVAILAAHDLVSGDQVLRARVAILPIGEALVVCDRADAADEHDRVCWPDDSSYHVVNALPPGRHSSWLDIGCGSGFGPLAWSNRATRIFAVDLNPRAVAYARLGAALSAVAHVQFCEADLANGITDKFSLVTCNAPIPTGDGGPMWRATTTDFVARLFDHVVRLVTADGLAVIHATADALRPVVAALPGERIVVVYTPEHHAREFAVAWWRPSGAPRLVEGRRELTFARPHVDHDDRVAALAG